MSRLTLRLAALGLGAGVLLLVFPQLVPAEVMVSSPESVAAMHDYVQRNVTCGDGSCADASYVDDSEFTEFDEEPACDCSASCNSEAGRWWVSADYLMWWVQGNHLPPLVTTGLLGQPGTSTLFGDERVDDDLRHGVRLTLGAWLDECQQWGVEGHYFYLGDASGGYQAASSGDPVLTRPFFNGSGVPQISPWASEIRIDTSSDVNSAGLLLRRTWLRSCQGQVAFLGGYRYFRLREELAIDENRFTLPGETIQVQDNFAVQNDFHGVDLGLAAQLQRGRWSLDALTKLGLGGVRQQLDITGRTQRTANGATTIINGGLLTQPSNIGHYSDTQFAFLPELGVNLGYCVTESLSLRAGYSLLWLTDALRTGDQIDTVIGNSGAPGAVTHPQASMDSTSVCVQGVSVGAEWRR